MKEKILEVFKEFLTDYNGLDIETNKDTRKYLKGRAESLDSLTRRLQDNYNDGIDFEQTEEDRLATYDLTGFLEWALAKTGGRQLTDEQLKAIESQGWEIYIDEDDNEIELGKHSPAGEDFSLIVDGEDFEQAIIDYAKDFDINEHTRFWVENQDGGAPESVEELLNDAKAIKQMLLDLAKVVEEFVVE